MCQNYNSSRILNPQQAPIYKIPIGLTLQELQKYPFEGLNNTINQRLMSIDLLARFLSEQSNSVSKLIQCRLDNGLVKIIGSLPLCPSSRIS